MENNINLNSIKAYNPTEREISLVEFICQYAIHEDGSKWLPATALNEVRDSFKIDDSTYTIRPQNSVDGKAHTWTFNK